MATLQTPREYLISLGLAKPTRGKFSKEALVALEKARNSGMEFKESPSVAKKTAKKVEASSYVPAEVRRWAKDNGIEVTERGRVPAEVVVQYQEAVKDAPKRSEAPTLVSGKDLRAEAPRVRMAERWAIPGTNVTRSFKDCCNQCGYSIGWCYCTNGPLAFADPTDNGNLVTMVPA